MTDANPSEILSDPLSEFARKERRNLLLSATVGALVAEMGLIPTRISALGVEFSPPEQKNFILFMGFVIVYFVLAFLVYGIADFFVWYKKYQGYQTASKIEELNWSQEDQYRYDELYQGIPRAVWLHTMSKPVAIVRIIFEFSFPLVVGISAISLLVLKIAYH